MESQAASLIDRLLLFDLCEFARKVGLKPAETAELTNADAVALLNLAEHLSRHAADDAEKFRCLTICALLWEHRREEWSAFPAFLAQVLGRLGLAPTIRMIDEGFEAEAGAFSPLGSLRAELEFTADQLSYEVQVAGRKTLLLSAFQRDLWRMLETESRVGVSGPTSAGKSYVLAHWIAEVLNRHPGDVFYIVPTLSLIGQVTQDVRGVLADCGMRRVKVLQTYTPSLNSARQSNVYVLTQERALSALERRENFIRPRLLIVDEVQNIERVANDDEERAHILADALRIFVTEVRPEQIVLSGPKLGKMKQFTSSLLGPGADAVTAYLPPVVNITYAFAKEGSEVYLRQYAGITPYPQKVRVAGVLPKAIGGRRYTDQVYDLLAQLTLRLQSESATIVFSPTSGQAAKIAAALAARRPATARRQELQELAGYIRESVHPSYSLAECVGDGVGYHHGKVPQHARVSVEKAFSLRMLDALVCTTTLMQGVNLPAKNLIARNPNLFVQADSRRENASLTSYEFANLRGRAGRLMKDFVGRAIILDEEAFHSHQNDLFGFPAKEVQSSFQSRFAAGRDAITAALTAGMPAHEVGANADLVTHIRHSILRYERNAIERLSGSGIEITHKDWRDTRDSLRNLSVPAEICFQCRYWDPLALDRLYAAYRQGFVRKVPHHPLETGFVQNLIELLHAFKLVLPYYYGRYFGVESESTLLSVAMSAQKWSSEVGLREIIDWEGGRPVAIPSERIDERVRRVNQAVVYQIPKLLKPLVLMDWAANPLLGFMELGASTPESRRLIELGVPREIAIKLRKRAFPAASSGTDHTTDTALIRMVSRYARELNFWERAQVQPILELA